MKWFIAIFAGALLTGLYFLREEFSVKEDAAAGRALASNPALAPVGAARAVGAFGSAGVAAGANGGVPAASPPSAKSEITALRETRACLDSGTCDFPQTDARSYEFAVNRKLAADLASASASLGPEALEEIARELISIDDGYVQEQAIRIFSALPPSRENVNSMVIALGLSHDPLVVEQAMNEWERYIGTPEEAMIQEFLADFIAHGGQFTSEKASSMVLRFLNERTESAFRVALAGMIPESTAAVNLRRALSEYERMVSGG